MGFGVRQSGKLFDLLELARPVCRPVKNEKLTSAIGFFGPTESRSLKLLRILHAAIVVVSSHLEWSGIWF